VSERFTAGLRGPGPRDAAILSWRSGQGDKSNTEISIRELLAQDYPGVQFIGFADGIGWYARQNDLKRMVSAYDDVLTFHADELSRFKKLLSEEAGL